MEVVWNDDTGATGGGVSDVFPLPAWQYSAGVPPTVNPGGAAHRIWPPRAHLPVLPAGCSLARGVDEALLVVTFALLEVVDLSMASPAQIEAPVQRGGFQMNIIRYDPLGEAMQQMRHQLFHQHFEQPYEETQGTSGGWSPLGDVFEDSEGITLKVELPEVDADAVDIQLEGNALTVRGERKLENVDKQEGYHRVERSYGAFSRRFTLPTTVETGNVMAQSRDGVLRIFLPKKAETKTRQIKVQTDLGLGGQGKQKQ